MLDGATQGLNHLVLPEGLWGGLKWGGGGVCSERRSFQAGQREEEQEVELCAIFFETPSGSFVLPALGFCDNLPCASLQPED